MYGTEKMQPWSFKLKTFYMWQNITQIHCERFEEI